MARVKDLWTKANPDRQSRKTRVHSARWGTGKRWAVVWTETGREVQESFTTRDAAEAYRARVEVGQVDGTWITKDKRDVTLADLWEPWIASKAERSTKTVDGYRSAWKHIEPVWGNTPACEIERTTIAAWLPTLQARGQARGTGTPASAVRPLGAASRRKVGIIINALLDLAVDQGIIHKNPIRSEDIPRQEKSERRYLKVHEIDALLAAAPHESARLLVLVLLMTGIRPGEAKGLKVKDLDPDRRRLAIRRDVDALGNIDTTKDGRHRDVPVGGDLLLDLEDDAENRGLEDWLLPDERGNVWTEARWRAVWSKMTAAAGIEGIDTYTLKHTAASVAIASGADVKTVQRMLGHRTAAMTLDVYGHLWDDHLDALPGAMEAHLEAERRQDRAKEDRRAERRRRRSLRAVE